jgi:hypothetical protein
MNHAHKRAAVGWIALLSIPILSWAQVADDSREKTEKVSDILSALQAEPGKRIADIGAGEGSIRSASLENADCDRSVIRHARTSKSFEVYGRTPSLTRMP